MNGATSSAISALDRAVELVGGDDLRHEPDRERLSAADPAPAHDDVLRPAEPDQPGEPLRPAGAGDHPDRRLGERHLHVVRGDPEVACERELEADAEDVPLQPRDHRLRAALRARRRSSRAGRRPTGDLVRNPAMSPPAVNWPPGAGEHDEPHRVVAVELGEELRELVAREHRDPVELPGHVEGDRGDAALGVVVDPEAVVFGHALSFDSSRRTLRRIFPDALFGSAGTKPVLARALEAGERRGEAVRIELLGASRRRRRSRRRAGRGGRRAPRPPPPRGRRGGSRARPRPRADGCSRRRRRSCRRACRRPRGRRRRRGGRCRPCGTSRRESPWRRHRDGSSSPRTPRRPRGARRSRRSARASGAC